MTETGSHAETDTRARSVELTFDQATDARVRAEWDALASAGLSSLAPHTSPSNAPHLTLLERRSPLPDDLTLDADFLPIPLVLGPIMLLGSGDRRVLARAVLPTSALLDLRSAVVAAAGPAPSGDDSGAPWLPHVTLARRLRVTDVATALDLPGDPFEASGTVLRRWDPATATVAVIAGA
ncbi:2'-5' RNA ligase family protein [Serinibacter arcticus]|uniref:2'-5' RNA ligase n=1 Tax=Serinibacter arcticus TaxID=1655435 RepID=A0A4Z1E5M6_9MICO|nr:2'-5' RNA ligase family protein [Serinibacter arcticus]TGO04921.1 hypothetical protein SERN_2514 [Serinibacter arcticus]